MIGKLKGIIDSIDKDYLIIDVGGVGYIVFCSARTLRGVVVGEAIGLIIETHVREDHINLYGFKESAERDWFRTLITVKGVGAKVALSILSVLSPIQITTAIAAKDKLAFTKISGIGPKLAERLLTELKDKNITDFENVISVSNSANIASVENNDMIKDAVSALTNLGYHRSEAYGVVTRNVSQKDNLDISELIRVSLKELAK